MKKIIFSAIVMAFVLVSCNQKNKEATTDHSNMMSNDSTMMDNDSIMINDIKLVQWKIMKKCMHAQCTRKCKEN